MRASPALRSPWTTAEKIARALDVDVDDPFIRGRAEEENEHGKRRRPATLPTERFRGGRHTQAARETCRAKRIRACAAAKEACRSYCEANELWTVDEAADFLAVDRVTVLHYLDLELLALVETRSFGAYRVGLLSRRAVKKFARSRRRATGNHGNVSRFQDRDYVFRWALKRGLSIERADELADRAEEPKRRYARVREGVTGRPKSQTLRTRLLAFADEVVAEGWATKENEVLGEVWFRDWQRERSDWEGYPAARHDPESPDRQWRKNGVERVRDLIGPDVEKLLQSAARKVA